MSPIFHGQTPAMANNRRVRPYPAAPIPTGDTRGQEYSLYQEEPEKTKITGAFFRGSITAS
jgi:hypothetical protein